MSLFGQTMSCSLLLRVNLLQLQSSFNLSKPMVSKETYSLSSKKAQIQLWLSLGPKFLLNLCSTPRLLSWCRTTRDLVRKMLSMLDRSSLKILRPTWRRISQIYQNCKLWSSAVTFRDANKIAKKWECKFTLALPTTLKLQSSSA